MSPSARSRVRRGGRRTWVSRRPTGPLAAFLLLALLVTGLMAATGPANAAPTPAPATARAGLTSPAAVTLSPETYERRVLAHINRVRTSRGLLALRPQACADRVAERWSTYLAREGAFYHQSMRSVLVECDAEYAGENLGRGAISPRRLVRMWMESPAHRAILTSTDPRRIGIGSRLDAQGSWVTAASFLRL